MDYISLGSSPSEEECVQVGSLRYIMRAKKECQRFLALIREKLGPEPLGAQLKVKRFPHDFGSYLEVVCLFEEDNEEARAYAYKCEAEAPTRWE